MKAKKCRRVKYSATKGDFSRVLREKFVVVGVIHL